MPLPGLRIRDFQPADLLEIMRLFHDTVHEINSRDYTAEQIDAWAPKIPDESSWLAKLRSTFAYVAEANGQIVGFANLERSGRIDCLYTHHMHQGMGIASRLLSEIETRARAIGARRLFTEASLTARPFYQRRGFRIVRENEVERLGVRLRNVIMERAL